LKVKIGFVRSLLDFTILFFLNPSGYKENDPIEFYNLRFRLVKKKISFFESTEKT